MKNLNILFLIMSIGFWSCNNQTTKKPNTSNEIIKHKDSVSTIVNSQKGIQKFQKNSIKLAQTKHSTEYSIAELEDFRKNGKSRTFQENDSLFIIFLKSFTNYQNVMNDSLYNSPNYETYNTLIYSDEKKIAPKALKFKDSMRVIGFQILSTEGAIFLEKDTRLIEEFTPFLSKGMNKFKDQYSKEINEPFSEDAEIIISPNEHMNRMFFWENFSEENRLSGLPNYANEQFETYLFYLMFGMDNSPIHDWNDSFEIKKKVLEKYKQIIKEYPHSKASSYLAEYLEFIENKKFKYDNSFNGYGKKKFPSMYGN